MSAQCSDRLSVHRFDWLTEPSALQVAICKPIKAKQEQQRQQRIAEEEEKKKKEAEQAAKKKEEEQEKQKGNITKNCYRKSSVISDLGVLGGPEKGRF